MGATSTQGPKGDSKASPTDAKKGPTLNSGQEATPDRLETRAKEKSIGPRSSLSETIERLKKIPTPHPGWGGEKAKFQGLMELARAEELSRADLEAIADAASLARLPEWIRALLKALLPAAHDLDQSLDLIGRMPTADRGWDGERDIFEALLTLAKRSGLGPTEVEKIADAAPKVVEKSWIRALLKALLPAAHDLDQSLDLIGRMPTADRGWDGERDIFEALLTLAKRSGLGPTEVEKIADAAPKVVEKSWIRALLKALLPAAQDLDQSLDLIGRMPTADRGWDGERDIFEALLTLAKRSGLGPTEVEKIADTAPMVVEKSWIRAVLKALLPVARDLDQSLDLIGRMPTADRGWDGEKDRFTALMALARRSSLSSSELEKISKAADLVKNKDWIRQIREQLSARTEATG